MSSSRFLVFLTDGTVQQCPCLATAVLFVTECASPSQLESCLFYDPSTPNPTVEVVDLTGDIAEYEQVLHDQSDV